jgi:hypothetical protein
MTVAVAGIVLRSEGEALMLCSLLGAMDQMRCLRLPTMDSVHSRPDTTSENLPICALTTHRWAE